VISPSREIAAVKGQVLGAACILVSRGRQLVSAQDSQRPSEEVRSSHRQGVTAEMLDTRQPESAASPCSGSRMHTYRIVLSVEEIPVYAWMK
jgi:hypothetical protein